jgi:type IV secretory pathway TrbD component
MALRTLPVRRAGNRPNLFLGGDRELMMFAGLLAFTLIVAAQDRLATVAGSVLWFATAFALRRMAKRDPKLRQVYLRHRRYRRYYPARSTPFRMNGSEQGNRYA